MRQGHASSDVKATKHEPISTTVHPGGAGQIGIIQGSRNAKVDLYGERHGQAPQSRNEVHHNGSQGKR